MPILLLLFHKMCGILFFFLYAGSCGRRLSICPLTSQAAMTPATGITNQWRIVSQDMFVANTLKIRRQKEFTIHSSGSRPAGREPHWKTDRIALDLPFLTAVIVKTQSV